MTPPDRCYTAHSVGGPENVNAENATHMRPLSRWYFSNGNRRARKPSILRERRSLDSAAQVCIAGMHRSGTSTLAQLLHLCGLYLGREDDLFRPRSDNPEGFWENRKFVLLNERLLETFGAGWDLPQPLEAGWHKDERLLPIRTEARRLLEQFDGSEPWGWKDPRNSLTLPFWASLLPEVKVVVCLRNPLEVALSLRRRGNSSRAFSMNLWEVYHRRLLDALPEERYVFTHYGAYFYRPLTELRRVLDILRMPASDQLVAHARSTALKDLRHHRFTTRNLLDSGVTSRVSDLYLRLCERANWDDDFSSARKTVGSGTGNPVT